MEPTVLPAQPRTGISMARGVRDLYTSISDPHAFNTHYPGLNLSCKEVLSVHFHTNIHLKKDVTKLISMDGSTFQILGEDAVSQSVSAVELIGGMRYGSQEMETFKKLH
jgi:hypothetical protein